MEYTTEFGSLDKYRKGTIEIIDDDPKHYAFSNIFEVAGMSAPYEKVAVGKNQQYVVEAIRAEGTSGWRTCDHDETVLCMDGEVTVQLVKLTTPLAPAGKDGSIAVDGEPDGPEMGTVRIRRGHMALLPESVRLPLRGGHAVRAPPADLPRRRHRRALGRHLFVVRPGMIAHDRQQHPRRTRRASPTSTATASTRSAASRSAATSTSCTSRGRPATT